MQLIGCSAVSIEGRNALDAARPRAHGSRFAWAAEEGSENLYRAVGLELDRRDLHKELLRVYGLAIAEDEEIIEETSRKFRASLYTLLTGLAAVGSATVGLSIWGVN